MTPVRIEKLSDQQNIEGFSCGEDALDQFLARFAYRNQLANASQTYLALIGDTVAGYYTLSVGDMEHGEAPERLAKGLARHPIPLMILARLAVDTRFQGKRIGSLLVRDAMERTIRASEIAGVRALVVHAKDDKARVYYERFGFSSTLTSPLELYLLVKDIRRSIEASQK